MPPYSRGCMTQPRGTGPASWASARGTWGDAASRGLGRARSSPGGVGAELQPLADPGGAPGAECSACDSHEQAQAEPDLVPWAPCPRPQHAGARGSGVFSDGAGGHLSAFPPGSRSGEWLGVDKQEREARAPWAPAPPGLLRVGRRR